MEIPHATLAQVRRAKNGPRVVVEEDVLEIAAQIRALDPSLHVSWSESGGYFVVYQQHAEGVEALVTTSLVLDGRLVERVRQLIHPSYDLAGELEKVEAEKQAEHDREQHERLGQAGERLAHAVRKDMGFKHRAFIPADPPEAA